MQQVVSNRPRFLTPKPLKPDYPLFVFLPGMDGTGQLLRSQLNNLEIAFDIRSLAISPNDFTSWEELAQQVAALIRAENRQEKRRTVYLCGESFGGCLALKVVLHAPELIDRLILINPASSFSRQHLLAWGAHLVKWFPSWFYPLSALALVPFLIASQRVIERELQQLITTLQMVPQKTTVWRLSLLKDFHVSEQQLRKITQPVLALASTADRLLPSVAEVERLVNILPNAQKVILPESGHACLLETEVDLYKILQSHNFLETPLVKSSA